MSPGRTELPRCSNHQDDLRYPCHEGNHERQLDNGNRAGAEHIRPLLFFLCDLSHSESLPGSIVTWQLGSTSTIHIPVAVVFLHATYYPLPPVLSHDERITLHMSLPCITPRLTGNIIFGFGFEILDLACRKNVVVINLVVDKQFT
jgi:hypothetical protein